jgi:hypothetical protein
MLRTSPERVISINDAPSRLAEIVRTIRDDQIWIVAEDDEHQVAIVDAQFLEQLMRRAWFDDLTTKTHNAFSAYLQREGYDAETMSEEEIEDILQK